MVDDDDSGDQDIFRQHPNAIPSIGDSGGSVEVGTTCAAAVVGRRALWFDRDRDNQYARCTGPWPRAPALAEHVHCCCCGLEVVVDGKAHRGALTNNKPRMTTNRDEHTRDERCSTSI